MNVRDTVICPGGTVPGRRGRVSGHVGLLMVVSGLCGIAPGCLGVTAHLHQFIRPT